MFLLFHNSIAVYGAGGKLKFGIYISKLKREHENNYTVILSNLGILEFFCQNINSLIFFFKYSSVLNFTLVIKLDLTN